MGDKEKILGGKKGLVGDLVATFYDFLNNGRGDIDYEVVDPVIGYEIVPARELLDMQGKRSKIYLIKPDRLPSSPEIRAIASYGKRVIIETTRVDFDGWRQELSLSQVGAYIPENQKTVKIEGGVSPIIKTRTQNAARGIEQKDVRTLLTILTPYGSEELGIAEDALNVLYNQSCFFPLTETYHSGNSELDSLVGEDSDSGGRGIGTRQEMRQGMERVLTELQRPALLLKMRVTSKKIIRAQVFRMTAEELKSEIEKKVAENPFLKID